MTELTEKVARAMSDALNVGKSDIVQWDRLHREERELYETAAQAAITTIEEERVGLRELADKIVSCGCCDDELRELRAALVLHDGR